MKGPQVIPIVAVSTPSNKTPLLTRQPQQPAVANARSSGRTFLYALLILAFAAGVSYFIFWLATKKPAKPDPCAGIECGTNGTCAAGVCACAAGWTGVKCDTAQTVDPCLNATCGVHGTCKATGATAVCTCDTGWTGTRCDTPSPLPPPTPCETNKLCKAPNGSCAPDTGECTCFNGYSGADCTIAPLPPLPPVPPPLPCPADYCGGHGTCRVDGTRSVCTCDAGWTGDQCNVPQAEVCNRSCRYLRISGDLRGSDLLGKSVSVASLDACETQCSATPGCVSAVAETYATGSRQCWLKSNVTGIRTSQQLSPNRTGLVRLAPPISPCVPPLSTAPWTAVNAHKLTGGEIVTRTASSLSDCQSICSQTPGCAAAEWTSGPNTCVIKSVDATALVPAGGQTTLTFRLSSV